MSVKRDTSDVGSHGEERLRQALDGVEGFLYFDEAWQLHEAARTRAAVADAVIVEIGSLFGRSATALAVGLKAATGSGRVYAIDPNRQPQFAENLERSGLLDVVDTIDETSHEARTRFADRSVDVLFVDGLHSYEGVSQDIDDWTPALKAGSIVAFNDIGLPGVRRALDERVVGRGSQFRRPYLTINTLFFEYVDETEPWARDDAVALVRLRFALAVKRLFKATRHGIIAVMPSSASIVKKISPVLTKIAIRPFLSDNQRAAPPKE